MILERIQDYEAGIDGPALRITGPGAAQIFHRPSDPNEVSGYLFSLFFGFSAPSFCVQVGNNYMILGQGALRCKGDSAPLELLWKGSQVVVVSARGALTPPLSFLWLQKL